MKPKPFRENVTPVHARPRVGCLAWAALTLILHGCWTLRMHCRIRLIILLLTLVPVLSSPGHAQAQSNAAPAAVPAHPAAAVPTNAPAVAAPALAPAQAQQVLDLLRDDKRRAEFTTVLESLAKAAPGPPGAATAAAPVAPTAPPPPVTKVLPLEPNSLGAQLVDNSAAALESTGAQLAAAVRSVNDLPMLWRWISTQANDADFRALALDALWRIAVAIGCGLVAEAAVMRLLRRMRAALDARSPDAAADGLPEPKPETGLAAAEAGATERVERKQQLNRATGTLRRLPYLLGLLALDLLPVVALAAVVTLLLGTRLAAPDPARAATLQIMGAYALTRVVLCVTAMLVSPAAPRLRLLHVSDWAARFLTWWTRRILIVGVTGYVLAEVGLLFGMYQTAHDALLKLFALVMHLLLIVAVLQARPHVAVRLRAPRFAHGAWASPLGWLANTWHLIAIFYIAALWLVWAGELRNGYARLIHFCLVTSAILIASRLIGVVLIGGLDRALRLSPAMSDRHPGFAERAAVYQPVLRAVITIVLSVATLLALFEAWDLGAVDWLMRNGLGGRVASAATTIGVTVMLAILVWEGVNAAIEQHLARLAAEAHLARAGRVRTLLPLLRTALLVSIVLVVALMAMSELGINIAPLLAGAGVIGIAVGFGSQKLVQDLITGLFLLLENAMQVGDIVTLGGLSGTVEALSIRTIRLRALDGSVHIIPFSAVTTVTNQTRDYGYAMLDISVGLNEEPDRIIPVVNSLAAEMRSDPKWASLVLDPLDVMGIEKFIDTAWVLRVRMKTQPASRWSVGRELNRRVKLRFDELAIESPLTSYRALSAPAAAPPAQEKAA